MHPPRWLEETPLIAFEPRLPARRVETPRRSGVDQAKPRLLDQVRAVMRARHYSLRTETAYIGWIRRFILFHGKRHPREMGESEITAFLTTLATEDKVASSTQNQALAALLRSPKKRNGAPILVFAADVFLAGTRNAPLKTTIVGRTKTRFVEGGLPE